jgi:hypothetical protein
MMSPKQAANIQQERLTTKTITKYLIFYKSNSPEFRSIRFILSSYNLISDFKKEDLLKLKKEVFLNSTSRSQIVSS